MVDVFASQIDMRHIHGQNWYDENVIIHLLWLIFPCALTFANWHDQSIDAIAPQDDSVHDHVPHKDFIDWTLILELKAAGLHKVSEGKEMILKLHSQMNNNRLSTNNPNINSLSRTQLHNDIKNLLAQPLDHKRKVKLVNL